MRKTYDCIGIDGVAYYETIYGRWRDWNYGHEVHDENMLKKLKQLKALEKL